MIKKGKYSGFWGKIKWKTFMIKIRWWSFSLSLKRTLRRVLYCSKGYHKLYPESLTISKSMKTKKGMRCVLKVEWLKCRNCDWSFFANDKDKKKYMNHQKRNIKFTYKLFNAMAREKKWK